MKVISGCQTGADEAGLRAAKALGISTGGTMPKGYKTQAGPRPDWAELYGLEESRSEKYPPRTRKNVKDSDVTIIFGDEHSPGCTLTKKYCDELGKISFAIPADDRSDEVTDLVKSLLLQFFMEHKPKIINIAGNREESNPGIGDYTYEVLMYSLDMYNKYMQARLDGLFEKD